MFVTMRKRPTSRLASPSTGSVCDRVGREPFGSPCRWMDTTTTDLGTGLTVFLMEEMCREPHGAGVRMTALDLLAAAGPVVCGEAERWPVER